MTNSDQCHCDYQNAADNSPGVAFRGESHKLPFLVENGANGGPKSRDFSWGWCQVGETNIGYGEA
jgi:hypothetical protein